MTTPEGAVKKQVKAILQNVKAYYTMPVTGGFGNARVPDFVVCYRGRFIGIETKAGENLLTALQMKHLEDIERAGGISLVINETNVSNLTQILEIIDHEES